MPNRAVRAYVGVLAVMAAALSVVSVLELKRGMVLDALCFALLFFFVEQLKSRLGSNVSVTLNDVVVTAMYPILGMWAAPTLLVGLLVKRPGRPPIRRVYNVSQNVICAFLGGATYKLLGGQVGTEALAADTFPGILVPVTAAILVFELANLILLTGILRLDTGRSLIRIIRSTFP